MKDLISKIKLKRTPYSLLNDLVSSATTIKRINGCDLYYIGGVCIFYIDNKLYHQIVCIDASMLIFFNFYYNFNDNKTFSRCSKLVPVFIENNGKII